MSSEKSQQQMFCKKCQAPLDPEYMDYYNNTEYCSICHLKECRQKIVDCKKCGKRLDLSWFNDIEDIAHVLVFECCSRCSGSIGPARTAWANARKNKAQYDSYKLGSHVPKCDLGVHSFKTNKRKKSAQNKTYRNGACVGCGKDFVDWNRIDKMDPDDVDFLFDSLKLERVRYDFWHLEIPEDELVKAMRKGRETVQKEVQKRLKQVLAPPANKIFRDGTQTPRSGNVIYYAQVFTATCCRKCVEEWYNIPRTRALTKKELDFFCTNILKYIGEKILS